MAVDLVDLAQHVVGKDEGALSAGERSGLSDLLAWGDALIGQYVGDSPIPDAVRDGALRRLCYYDYHVRLSRRPADGGQLDARFRRDAPLSPLRASGALSLLAPFKRRAVGVAS